MFGEHVSVLFWIHVNAYKNNLNSPLEQNAPHVITERPPLGRFFKIFFFFP